MHFIQFINFLISKKINEKLKKNILISSCDCFGIFEKQKLLKIGKIVDPKHEIKSEIKLDTTHTKNFKPIVKGVISYLENIL